MRATICSRFTCIEGSNTVLVKDGNIGGDWRFVFEIPSVQETEKISTERARRDAIESFQEVEIVPKEYHSYVFFPGEFPTIQWSNPERVKAVWGDVLPKPFGGSTAKGGK